MATLSTTRNYADGEVLVGADLDAFLDDVETFVNVTKLDDDNIQDNGITGSSKLLNQSVTAAKLAADSVTTIKIADGNVTTAKIADSNVTTDKIADSNVTTDKIADTAVTTAKITDANITTAKLADTAVTTIKITDANVTTAKIADSAVTTAKINDGAVTRAKLTTNYVAATIATDASWTNGETKTIGNLAVNGRPVKITICVGAFHISDDATAYLQYSANNSTWSNLGHIGESHGAGFFTRDLSSDGAFVYIHTPSAGTAYYRVNLSINSGSVGIDTAMVALVEEL